MGIGLTCIIIFIIIKMLKTALGLRRKENAKFMEAEKKMNSSLTGRF